MKKLLSLALALVLALSMCTVAFADNQDLTNYLDKEPVVSKTYQINNGTAPAETFTFKFEGVSYKNGDGKVVNNAEIPAIGNVEIPFDELSETSTETVEAKIDADKYELGVYTYKVTEVVPETKTAGVTYSDEELYLVLTILRDEDSNKHYVAAMHYETANGDDKTTGFTNEYDAGSLSVTKDIKGNMADMNKEFEFSFEFNAPSGETVNSAITVSMPNGNTTTITFDGETTCYYTIMLGDDDTVTFTNIPEGVTYTVSEDAENYESDNGVFSDETKYISANDTDTVTFTNTLTKEVDTGISLDSAPYILMLAVAVIGCVVLVSKKRA